MTFSAGYSSSRFSIPPLNQDATDAVELFGLCLAFAGEGMGAGRVGCSPEWLLKQTYTHPDHCGIYLKFMCPPLSSSRGQIQLFHLLID